MSVHVVSKADNRQHATFDLPSSDPSPLKPSSVRVRSSLLSLSSNNLTYALYGTFARWWDAYPVPPTAPAPYNGSSEWGTILFGFWATGSHSVDLELTHSELDGHWKEISEYRASLMPLYNRYRVFDTQGTELAEFAWDVAVGTIFVAGYLLSEYIFTPDPAAHPPIHPCGIETETGVQDWTVADADLLKAVFVVLGASTKMARSTVYDLFKRPSGAGPLGEGKFAVGTLGYPDVGLAGKWIAGVAPRPERIVIADFGGRAGTLERVVDNIKTNESLQDVKAVIIAVGNEQKTLWVYTADEIQAQHASFVSLAKVQMNTSGVYEAAIKLRGAADCFCEVDKAWKRWLEDREAAAPDLHLVWGEGIAGERGIAAGWDKLCAGSVAPGDALVYRV
ncbi:hypothetical protein BDW66DRAFT_155176 [Aspergillus desertorum]